MNTLTNKKSPNLPCLEQSETCPTNYHYALFQEVAYEWSTCSREASKENFDQGEH